MPKNILYPISKLFKVSRRTITSFGLICISNHIQYTHSFFYISNERDIYIVANEISGLEYDDTLMMISDFVANGNKCLVVRLSSSINKSRKKKIGIILFNNFPPISHLPELISQPKSQINFSVCIINEDYMKIKFAKKTNKNTPNFALGCLNYLELFEKIKQMINHLSNESQIRVLYEKIIHSLYNFGYFDIFDINHFQSIVLMMFLKMFSRPENRLGNGVLRNLFLSLVQQFLSNNCWFMIVGDKYRAIQGRPSSTLIELFLNPICLPTVNFVSNDFVGLVMKRHDVCDVCDLCILVSVSTTEIKIYELGLLHYYHYGMKSPNVDVISNALFGPPIDTDDTQEKFDISDVPCGVLTDFRKHFKIIVFKIGNFFNVFLHREHERFEWFCPYFFLMLHLFAVNDIIIKLTNHFQYFFSIEREELVEALVRDCGFESIINGSATTEQLYKFIFDSDFGVLLQHIIHDFGGFLERLRECCSEEDGSRRIKFLQKNQYVFHLRRIFETILEKLQERADLSQEIRQILSSLDQIVKFLKPVPPHLE